MKTFFYFFIIFILPLFYGCKKENNLPTIDFSSDLSVSKGTYVDRINILWDAPPKSKIFEVYRADSLNSEYTLIAKTEKSFYSDSSKHTVSKKYFYKVRVYNSEEDFSEFSNSDYGFVSEFLAPTIYQNSLFGSEKSYISIDWSSVNGSTMYYIYRSSNNIDFNILDSTTLNTYKDNDSLIASIIYYYKIKAFNRLLGFTEFSNLDSAYIYQNYTLTKSFGNFTLASYIDFDSKGNIYIVDATVGEVKMYDKDYNFIKVLEFKHLMQLYHKKLHNERIQKN